MATTRAPSFAVQAVAWLGGAAFVAALAFYGWFFVLLGRPGPVGVAVTPAIAWNVALFTLFALHHSVMARTGAKAWIARTVPAVLERSAYVWVASALLIAVCLLWQRVPGLVYRLPGATAWLGWTAQACGV
ncbi:MAG: isoprenylcysteine carboxylmethyltransferase family protein, partial [Acidobacteriota bacterium]